MERQTHLARRAVHSALSRHERLTEQIASEERSLEKSHSKVADVLTAQKLLQTATETVQQSAHEQLASVVSRCLEAVFEEPYSLKINFAQKRGRTEAELVFVRDGQEIDPVDAAGGGVIDLASFSLRLACLCLSNPRKRRVLFLDEPFKMLSAGYSERVGELLLTLSEEMNLQIILITHNQDLRIGKVIELGD